MLLSPILPTLIGQDEKAPAFRNAQATKSLFLENTEAQLLG